MRVCNVGDEDDGVVMGMMAWCCGNEGVLGRQVVMLVG